jgi:[protein-PII] uridylyltransferase
MDLATTAHWREEYAAAREALITAYLARPRPHALLTGLSRAADRLFRNIWQTHRLPRGVALVAVGGYGRAELYPQSDVDVLILLDGALPEAERARIEPLIGLFWDVGLPAGHSVRTLEECLAEAAKDITIQTNMLEARLLAGDRELFQEFRRRYAASLDPVAFYEAKALEQEDRHGRAADRALRLEPNVKESPGGLRDLQTVGWVCAAAGLPSTLSGLAGAGLLSPEEARRLNARHRFMAHLRIRLHLAVNRREDRLLFELQGRLAQELGIRPKGNRRAAEVLMQRYFQAAREMSLANELLLGAMRCRLKPVRQNAPLRDDPAFARRGTLLDFAEEDLPESRSETLLGTFLTLQHHPDLQGLAPGALRTLWRAGRSIDAAFRRQPGHRAQFMALLREPYGVTRSLRLMHRLGILGRYLPAFGRITGQLQHDLYHIYPVDEHILMVLRNLRRMAIPALAHESPLAHRLITGFDRPELLYLAALFHDIAKGRGGDHSSLGEGDARSFCRQHRLERADEDLVAWLVREHLTLSHTAQTQDLSDPAVVTGFARSCGDVRRLTALYLLTVADIRGTNPQIWNAWKDNLLRELYLASRRVLEGDRPALDGVEEKKERARATLRLYGYPKGAEDALWNRVDDVWFLRLSAQEIAWQTRRLLPVLAREQVVVRARLAPIGEGVQVLVYAPDQEALFARICAFFAGMEYSVLEAKIHTTRDGYALDSFLAMDPGNSGTPYRDILSYIEYTLGAGLKAAGALAAPARGRLPRQLRSFPLDPQVLISPSDTNSHYLLSLVAGDRPGLLYDVARLLHAHRTNVVSAKINTLGQRVEDVFVLEGSGLDNGAERLALEQELVSALRVG